MKRIENLLASADNLYLVGGAYRGVGIPDCIRGGEDAAEGVVRRLVPSVDDLSRVEGLSAIGS
jgi:oxygen-dependent protoporphyrinogen oxidase